MCDCTVSVSGYTVDACFCWYFRTSCWFEPQCAHAQFCVTHMVKFTMWEPLLHVSILQTTGVWEQESCLGDCAINSLWDRSHPNFDNCVITHHLQSVTWKHSLVGLSVVSHCQLHCRSRSVSGVSVCVKLWTIQALLPCMHPVLTFLLTATGHECLPKTVMCNIYDC